LNHFLCLVFPAALQHEKDSAEAHLGEVSDGAGGCARAARYARADVGIRLLQTVERREIDGVHFDMRAWR